MSNIALDPLIGVAFWLMVAVAVVASKWCASSRNREKQKTIRLAIEKGMPLDAAAIDSLDRTDAPKPEHFYIAGFLSIPGGVGLIIMGILLGRIAVEALYPLVGAGILAILVGAGLLGLGRWLGNRRNQG